MPEVDHGWRCRTGEAPGFPYGQRCLFVANDWHAALVPSYLAGKYRRHGVFKDARCILAIHNMAHQGVEPAHTFASLGLPDDWYLLFKVVHIAFCEAALKASQEVSQESHGGKFHQAL